MIHLDRPVIVEGQYDKQKLSSILDATIITTNGFGIFNDGEKRALIRRLAEKNGIFVLTDADGAGMVIRNLLRGCVPPDRVIHLYIPPVQGKERRKSKASKAGLLGVEGIDEQTLRRIFAPFSTDAIEEKRCGASVSKADFYEYGLSGGAGSAQARAALCRVLHLPENMSANALLEAINLLLTEDEFFAALEESRGEDVL
ncbi:MAG: DUF4093 domain-containing protein [Clostridia bacterium]|nr:DUF4093 domain-containing protein [Clostridia bacterium]